MVVALIVIGTFIKPQHKLSNLRGHKKDEELRDTDRDKDKEITMVPGAQQSKVFFVCAATAKTATTVSQRSKANLSKLRNCTRKLKKLVTGSWRPPLGSEDEELISCPLIPYATP
jgi:hypothetical protein